MSEHVDGTSSTDSTDAPVWAAASADAPPAADASRWGLVTGLVILVLAGLVLIATLGFDHANEQVESKANHDVRKSLLSTADEANIIATFDDRPTTVADVRKAADGKTFAYLHPRVTEVGDRTQLESRGVYVCVSVRAGNAVARTGRC